MGNVFIKGIEFLSVWQIQKILSKKHYQIFLLRDVPETDS